MNTYEQALMQGNAGRHNESLIDDEQRIQLAKRQGLGISQIAARLSTNQQIVRSRLQAICLSLDEQKRLHTGSLSIVSALKMLRNRENGEVNVDQK